MVMAARGTIIGVIKKDGQHLSGDIRRTPTIYENDYENLINKPQIESVELVGNKQLEEIGVDHLAIEDLIHILD